MAAMTVVDPAMTDTERLRDQSNLATTTGPKGKCSHLAATEKVQGMNSKGHGHESYVYVQKYETCF